MSIVAKLKFAVDDQSIRVPVIATNFTVSIEAAEGVTTGISAADRALTIQKAVAPDAKPTDLVQPGSRFSIDGASGRRVIACWPY